MSDPIKHECGIALIRLRKPLAHYQKKYGTPSYGLQKLFLLMEKQHNRGQDGAGMATIKRIPNQGSTTSTGNGPSINRPSRPFSAGSERPISRS